MDEYRERLIRVEEGLRGLKEDIKEIKERMEEMGDMRERLVRIEAKLDNGLVEKLRNASNGIKMVQTEAENKIKKLEERMRQVEINVIKIIIAFSSALFIIELLARLGVLKL